MWVTIIGLVAAFITIYEALKYREQRQSPEKRFKKYLKDVGGWAEFPSNESETIYRYKKFPDFELFIDWDNEVRNNFEEEWINDSLFRDKTNNTSYSVEMRHNSITLKKNLFVALDGFRFFVPVPNVEVSNGLDFHFYDETQQLLASIVGKYSFLIKNLQEFALRQKKPITIITKHEISSYY